MPNLIKTIAGALLLWTVSAAAQAPQPRVIPVSADAPFRHANSGLVLPNRLIDLPRTQVREFDAPELDINATYADANRELSVYVYRVTIGAVPVWFDRATWAIEARGTWGKLAPVAAPTAIAPPGRTTASGLTAAWSITGGSYTGTAVAVLPLGEWLVKLRYSSKADDGPGAAARLQAALSALTWPATASASDIAAVPVADCTSTLAFKGTVKPVKPDATSVMMGALLAAAAGEGAAKGAPQLWCRDATRVSMGALYRPDGATDRYLLALSDAGRGVSVGPSPSITPGARASWSVDLVTPGRTLTYPAQDRLPAPPQVMAMLGGPAASSVVTWGQKREVTLPSTLFK